MSNLMATATAPANIALIKYWGKADATKQWPANSSLSMTFSSLKSTSSAQLIDAKDHELFINGDRYQREDLVGIKAFSFLDFLSDVLEQRSKLRIDSTNSFPMACGIASSASGMAALSIAAIACWLQKSSFVELANAGFSRERLAMLAGRGSGSACRSLWGGFVKWEKGENPCEQRAYCLHPQDFWDLSDLVVVVGAKAKKVSSSEGHAKAWSSPLFSIRLSGMEERLAEVEKALAGRDIQRLGPILEQEALEMHAVMLSAVPAISYLTQASIDVIQWLRYVRSKENIPAYFTIDAGPNIHIICEAKYTNRMRNLLNEEFSHLQILQDHVGAGPTLSLQS